MKSTLPVVFCFLIRSTIRLLAVTRFGVVFLEMIIFAYYYAGQVGLTKRGDILVIFSQVCMGNLPNFEV